MQGCSPVVLVQKRHAQNRDVSLQSVAERCFPDGNNYVKDSTDFILLVAQKGAWGLPPS